MCSSSSKNSVIPRHQVSTKELKAFGFDMIDLSVKTGKQYNSSVSHRHSYYELFLFDKKGGKHLIDFKEYPIEGGSVHFVSEGQIHQLQQKQESGLVICFTEDFIAGKDPVSVTEQFPFFDSAQFPVLKLSKPFASELQKLALDLYREFEADGRSNSLILQSYLNIILSKIRTYYLKEHTPAIEITKSVPYQNFKKLVNIWYERHLDVSRYAEELGISANHLNALCKQQEGQTASTIIQERLLLESKRLLYNSSLQIKEIAYQLNFEDLSYFNRFFKKKTGLTPLEFRKNKSY